MKRQLYSVLAFDGMKKNKQLYLPYLLSCIGVTVMLYIMQALSSMEILSHMSAGAQLRIILDLGKVVIAIFAVIFLFYTNSFLVRRRYKEFGLYNILGMDKRGICRIVLWETLIAAITSIGFGLILGILLSKLAELALCNIVHTSITYDFTLRMDDILVTAAIFAAVFLLLSIRCVIQVARTKPLELFHAENLGEKPPKANWISGLGGIAVLAAAYYLAVDIDNPIGAITLFFFCVLLVIVATYMIFTAGSVLLCKLLQKNKNYYYKKQNFVSVSTMSFRMKRNGSGLASICILSTMVLVMISSSSSLYFGTESSMRNQYPRDCQAEIRLESMNDFDNQALGEVRKDIETALAKTSYSPVDITTYHLVSSIGMITDTGAIDISVSALDMNFSKARELTFITVDEYNKATGQHLAAIPGSVYVHPVHCSFSAETITIGPVTLPVAGICDAYPFAADTSSTLTPSYLIVVSSYEDIMELDSLTARDSYRVTHPIWYYGFNINGSQDEAIDAFQVLNNAFYSSGFVASGNFRTCSTDCIHVEREDFYSTFGGLFFIGIILSILFLFACVLIIYYKQISEGYEDQSRFEIMQKVGMTKDDIKKSINSQMLTVFFAPLVMAGLHLIFAFPIVWQMLQLFNLTDKPLVMMVNLGAFGIFAVLYVLVYRITAKSYYSIVS